MALQIRRGLESERAGITPDAGELLYTTDEKLVYVGDGATLGGNQLLSNILEDTTPQLGGDLDVNGYKIITTGNGNIELDPGGSGNVVLHGTLTIDTDGNLTKIGQLNISPTPTTVPGAIALTSFGRNDTLVDGNVFITRNTYGSAFSQGFTFAQHYGITSPPSGNADATNFTFYRSRGTGVAPTAVLNGDDIADIAFLGHDGTSRVAAAAISVVVDGSPVTGAIPSKITLATNNGTTFAYRAELSPAGAWKVDTIQALTANTALSFGGMAKLVSYASETAANNAVGGVPTDGMIYYDSTALVVKAYGGGSWHALW